MMSLIVTLFIFAVVAGVLLWAARRLLAAFGVPQPMESVIYVGIVLLLLGLFLSEMGWMGPVHGWRTWR